VEYFSERRIGTRIAVMTRFLVRRRYMTQDRLRTDTNKLESGADPGQIIRVAAASYYSFNAELQTDIRACVIGKPKKKLLVHGASTGHQGARASGHPCECL
jgi:hypothetical protein